MTTTKSTREASRNQARKWFEERKNLKEKVNGDSDDLAAMDGTTRKPSKRVVLSRKKENASTKAQDSQKPKRTTRTTRATKDDDSIGSASSKESTSSIRKLINRVTRPLKKNATSKGTSNDEEKRPVRRSQRKSLSVPAPVSTSQRIATRRSRKVDDVVVEDAAATNPSNESTAKKSNCARESVPKVELQTVLSSALASFKEPVSPTDSLSTTFSELEMSVADIVESVAEFNVEEISIVKSRVSDAVNEDIPALGAEEPATNESKKENSKLVQASVDPPASSTSVNENGTTSYDGKVLVEDENSFPELVLAATEDDSVDGEIVQEKITEAEGSDRATSATTAVPVSATPIALVAAMIVFAALVAYFYGDESALSQSKAVEFFDKGSVQFQKRVSALFDSDGSIGDYVGYAMEKFQEASHFVEAFSKDLQGEMTDSSRSWGRDLSMAVTGGVYSIAFRNSPKTTFAASVLAMGAVVYVTK